ncbi:hypothetical protein E0Z10_g274 [Xylaria hypoxylon]|uniref:ATP-dependent DNA helicase PIF1 n=1 Tax=Xylaria hypoxylon TaxID=37992 RepID=A0A4Z0Z973_9PEZI|nr:hypothetical protein E0Z10_g274 [Xylaria hypoxylon]
MLGRARDRAGGADASNPTTTTTSTATSATKSDLAKQLFPLSSSPSSQQPDITSWATSANKPRSAALSSTTHVINPFKPRSSNPPPLSATRPSSIIANAAGMSRTNSLVSICSNAGSFEDRESSFAKPQSHGSAISSVFVSEEDFSDDNTLELDYECPASLPPLPPPSKPKLPSTARPIAATTITTTTITTTGLPPPPTSQIPWSSSPCHHMFPPEKSQKPESKPSNHILPPATKRTLPKTWSQETVQPSQSKESASPFQATDDANPSATPLPNKKRALPWDTTQSAVKERRKQLKNQNKNDGQLSRDEMRASADDHVTQKTKASAISLSSEQQHVIDLVVKDGRSVFFTGPAGTGKSVLMRAIISELKKKWARDPERLSVTASTGLAACNIGGQTLHSFAGIGLGKEDVPTLVKKIRRNAKAKNRWLRTKTLIIDEVSMVDGDLFDKLSQIAREIRKNGRAFGGIQLIITGDFFQLPPVPDGGKKEAKFAFDAGTWNTSIDHTIGLTQVFRQKDPQFAGMLNEMRLGRISNDTVQTFKDLARPLTFDDGLGVTELFPTRYEVERSNESRLRNLPGDSYHYESLDAGDPNIRDKLLANMMAPKSIDLKKGAQVMLIKNMDDTLVNGSLGKVMGFMSEATFENWAMNDHGTGSDDEMGFDGGSKKKIKAFSRDPESVKDLREYPVVRFTATDGSHRSILCILEDWKVELPTGEVQASRKQLPLILAWALSIHKAQGQTLERVKVDLGKVFEKGQAYVALSRAVSKMGLQVLRFEKSKVMAHPRVIQFYDKLYSAESAIKTKKAPIISEFAHKGASSTSAGRSNSMTVVDLDEEEAMVAAYG